MNGTLNLNWSYRVIEFLGKETLIVQLRFNKRMSENEIGSNWAL